MAKWSEQEIQTLREMAADGFTAEEVAKVIGRSPSSVSGAAYTREIAFQSHQNSGLRSFLKEGGCIQREDFGGAIGVLWSRANRSEKPERYNTKFCEKLLNMGWLKQAPMATGEVYCRA